MPEERKLVTVLFADIVGSTAITSARDPEVVRAALRRTFDEVRPIIEAHGGTVEKFIGDEVMAVFGIPQVHDDDADRAVRSAFAIRERVKELSTRPKAIPLELRIGINTGEAVAGTDEASQFLVTGEPVIAAARIRGAAEPGEVVVGALTYQLTNGVVSYGEARSVEAKGLGRLDVRTALAPRSDVPMPSRGVEGLRAPLIGRDEELSLVLNAFERMRNEARPQLVTVFGAAGAGKSRLAEEFTARLGAARVRQGRCLPYGEGITLWPIQNVLRTDADIAPTDDLATARQRLRDAVTSAFPAGADDVDAVQRRLEVLAGLARADDALPEVAASDLSDELAWGLRRYLERRAGSEPLVLVFEDLHWAAPALLELIEHLAEWSKAPLFIVCLARPEFLDTRPGWGGGKVNAASIVLEPLTADETRELVARLLDIDSLSEAMRSAVVERSEGNPLYVEEFIRLLIESGQIGHRDGKWIAIGAGPLQVPPTLQGLIAARIDTAPPAVKALLQKAAVIGRAFPTTGVAALSEGKAPDPAHLRDAVRRDLLVDIDERGVGGGRVFRFKHVLIRDVAYASVPKAERARLHDEYVRWYEETLGDRREDFSDLIAYHAEQAYLLASEMEMQGTPRLARRAFEHLLEAATRARVREDDAASLAFYRRVTATTADAELTEIERLELDGYLALVLNKVEATSEALQAIDDALARARAQGATRLLIEFLGARFPWYEDDRRDTAREELRRLALATEDPVLTVRALMWRISVKSPLSEDIRYLTEALAYATAHGLGEWRFRCHVEIADRQRDAFRFSEAEQAIAEMERAATPVPTRRQRASVLGQRVQLLLNLFDGKAAVPLCDELIALRHDIGDFRGEMWAMLWKARALALVGNAHAAGTLLDELIGKLAGKVAPRLDRLARLWRAYLFTGEGRIADARSMLDSGLAYPVKNPWFAAWASWISATVRSAEGDFAAAIRLLREAADLYERLEASEALFHFDRARILIRAGRGREARDVLQDLRAKLTDPLADRLRERTDELLAECAALPA